MLFLQFKQFTPVRSRVNSPAVFWNDRCKRFGVKVAVDVTSLVLAQFAPTNRLNSLMLAGSSYRVRLPLASIVARHGASSL